MSWLHDRYDDFELGVAGVVDLATDNAYNLTAKTLSEQVPTAQQQATYDAATTAVQSGLLQQAEQKTETQIADAPRQVVKALEDEVSSLVPSWVVWVGAGVGILGAAIGVGYVVRSFR